MPDDDKTASLCLITKRIVFTYKNWRGEVSRRTVEPTDIWYGVSEWHPEPQWIMAAADLEKGQLRYFALRDMRDVTYAY